jgi:hypothetical protein
MTDEHAIKLALADMAAINNAPKRAHVDGIGRDQLAELVKDGAGKWSWYGYASEAHGFASKADAARAYISEHGI